MANNLIVSFEDIGYSNEVIIAKLFLEIKKSGIYHIIGRNGIGKSTFFKVLNGELKYKQATVTLDSQEINIQKNTKIIKIDNNFYGYEFLTSFEYIIYILRVFNCYASQKKRKIQLLLEILNMSEFSTTLIKELSEGTKQKLSFVITLLLEGDILLFDESFEHIDIESNEKIIELLMKETEKIIFIISHTNSLKIKYDGVINFEEMIDDKNI